MESTEAGTWLLEIAEIYDHCKEVLFFSIGQNFFFFHNYFVEVIIR